MTATTIRLVSWNAAHRKCCSDQVREIESLRPDLVALQEVTAKTAVDLRRELKRIGLQYSEDSLRSAKAPRAYGVLIASKWPLESARLYPHFRLPERLLSQKVDTPIGLIEVSTAYIKPGSSDAELKLETLEGIYRALARTVEDPRILCGDFNAPQDEGPKGEIVTWGQYRDVQTNEVRTRKTWRGMPGTRYDKAERDILDGLREFGLSDVYRRHNDYSSGQYSWWLVRKDRAKGRRFDHIFASDSLNVKNCRYTHTFQEMRKKGLSDHSPIEVTFNLKPSTASHG
ncbi:MAG TPA: endonuclease/exonuclease/phosphatase family protein [Terriglobia bacterium]|nr:endonuclease/exonuclease/phosphatase family protein [Terriglobia bacterium]